MLNVIKLEQKRLFVAVSCYNSNYMQFSEIISQVSFCRFAANSNFFICYEGKKIYIKQCSVSLNNFAVIPLNSPPSDIIISPNSQLLAVLFKEKTLILIYNTKGTLIARIEDSQAGMAGILWSPDSLQLLVFSQLLYKCTIYNLIDKTTSLIRSPKLSTAKGCIFSSNGKFMALLQKHDCKDTISIYYCGDWKLLNSIQMDSFDIVQMKWDSHDSHIIAWENPINYRFYAICPFKGVMLRYQPYDYALGIKSVQYSNTSYFVAIGSFDEKIRLLNAKTWKLIAELDLSNPLIQSDFTKIYRQEEIGKGTTQLKVIDRSQYKIPITKPQLNDKSAPAQGVGLLEFSYDDRFLASRNDNMPFTVWIWNVSSLEVQAVISFNSQVKMLRWDKGENNLCIVCGNEKVLFWKNGVILECAFRLDNRKFNIQKISWSEDRKKMLLFDKSQAIYSDLVSSD